jgi:endonuclease YncB( thermonuclease family)
MPVAVDFDFERIIRPASRKRLLRAADGDTPMIEQPIRLVSCDTPEKAGYAGLPATSQLKLDTCRTRLEDGFYPEIDQQLSEYLVARLADGAADAHIAAANHASAAFDQLLEQRLTQPSGNKRPLAVIATGEILDRYGRLLAYMAPWLEPPLPPRNDPDRRTFNLDMIENGWAAFFPIYPSLPQNEDMNLAIAAAETAWDLQRGPWATHGETFLLAYEFRLCIKLGTARTAEEGMQEAFQRICVDLPDLRIAGKLGFHEVPPPYRLWVWQDDLEQAREDLGLHD